MAASGAGGRRFAVQLICDKEACADEADQPGSGHARSSHLGFQPNSRTPVTKNHAGNCSQRRLDATMWRN